MPTYYLSGPMRGYPELNFPAFESAAKTLRNDGLSVISPHELGDPSSTRGVLMGEDLLAIINDCDGVICLPNWRHSPGACAEVAVAFVTEKPVYDIVEVDGQLTLQASDCTVVRVPREDQYRTGRPLIGLCGFAQSGKDTVASYLVDGGWTRVAFADSLRDVLYALDPIVVGEGIGVSEMDITVQYLVDGIGWDRAKTEEKEVRRLLQRLGTEAGRECIDDNLWVSLGEQKIEAAGTPVIVTDCRFPNEIHMVKRRGGTLVWVQRPGVGAVNTHASEHSVKAEDCSHVLMNDGTLEDLYFRVDGLLRDMGLNSERVKAAA